MAGQKWAPQPGCAHASFAAPAKRKTNLGGTSNIMEIWDKMEIQWKYDWKSVEKIVEIIMETKMVMYFNGRISE